MAKVMVVASVHAFKDLVAGWPVDSYKYVETAQEAIDAWSFGPQLWSAIITELAPGLGYREARTPQRRDGEEPHASGLGLMRHVRRSPGCEQFPLLALVSDARSWGDDALFAVFAVDVFGAVVLDRSVDHLPRGEALYKWITKPTQQQIDRANNGAMKAADVVAGKFYDVQKKQGAAGPRTHLHNVILWFQGNIHRDYEPTKVHPYLIAAFLKRGWLEPPSIPTVKKRLALTFNSMIPVAEHYRELLWSALPSRPPREFWAQEDARKGPRAFINAGQVFFSFDDIEEMWEAQSEKLAVRFSAPPE